MVITFLLSLNLRAGATGGPRPKFHHRECQACLLDHRGVVRGLITPRFRGLTRFLFRVERTAVQAEPPEDFARQTPQFIWFSSALGATTAPRPSAAEPVGRATVAPRPAGANLSDLELGALGLGPGVVAGPRGLTGRVTVSDAGWAVEVRAPRGARGGFALPADDLEVGYTNKVYQWQWAQIAGRRWGPRATRALRPADFLVDYAHTVLTRPAGHRRYGYFIRTYVTPDGHPTVRVDLASLWPSPRRAVNPEDLIFPRAGDGVEPFETPPIHWGVSELGLTLVLAPDPAPE